MEHERDCHRCFHGIWYGLCHKGIGYTADIAQEAIGQLILGTVADKKGSASAMLLNASSILLCLLVTAIACKFDDLRLNVRQF